VADSSQASDATKKRAKRLVEKAPEWAQGLPRLHGGGSRGIVVLAARKLDKSTGLPVPMQDFPTAREDAEARVRALERLLNTDPRSKARLTKLATWLALCEGHGHSVGGLDADQVTDDLRAVRYYYRHRRSCTREQRERLRFLRSLLGVLRVQTVVEEEGLRGVLYEEPRTARDLRATEPGNPHRAIASARLVPAQVLQTADALLAAGLWPPGTCAACGRRFVPAVSGKVHCSPKCEEVGKKREWRKDPEVRRREKVRRAKRGIERVPLSSTNEGDERRR